MMTTTEQHWMELAISAAVEGVNSKQGGPFGAVIVRENKLIASAFNTVTSTLDPTAHAEINAIRQACRELGTYNLNGCALFSSCEPCPMCMGAILWARISELYYCADRLDAEQAGFDDACFYHKLEQGLKDRSTLMTHIAHPQRKRPFELWLNLDDKELY